MRAAAVMLSAALLVLLALPVQAGISAAAGAPTPPPPAGDSEPGDDSGDQAASPPAEAPVPDPFLAEMLKTCRDGASGDSGTFQRLNDAGWGLAVDGDTQTPYYQAFNGEKNYDGVGFVQLTYSVEVYPSMTEGYCSLSIDSAQRKIGIADLSKVPEIRGEMRTTDDGIASNWQDSGPNPKTFIQADQHKRDLYFLLDVTTLLQKPAAEIPYVKPDDNNTNNTDDSGDGDPGLGADASP